MIAEELRQTEDTPSELVHLLLDSAMWGDQPLGRDIAGDEESVAGLTREQVLDSLAHALQPGEYGDLDRRQHPGRSRRGGDRAGAGRAAGRRAWPRSCRASRRAPARP